MSNIFRCILKRTQYITCSRNMYSQGKYIQFCELRFFPTSYKTVIGSTDDSEGDKVRIHI